MTTTHEHFTKVTENYLATRDKLEKAAARLQRLQEQRAATLQSRRDAGQRWRQLFKEGDGAAGKEVRNLQAEESTLASEVEQLDELIGELKPHVDELRHWAGELRQQHVHALRTTRREVAARRLSDALDAVFNKPEGQELLQALALRATSLNAEVIEDSVFMAGLGFDAHESAMSGFMAKIAAADRAAITREVKRRKKALIADAAGQRLARLEGSASFEGDLASPIAALLCER
nr:hypothetical protein [Halomonas socia]